MTENTQDIAYNLLYYQSNLEPNVEMAISIGDQQRIFLAYRALFKGQNAQVRQNKTIKKILISSKASSSPLVRSLGLDKVVSVLKRLLEKEVFSSELKAKVAFPILYKTSPEQNARHEASDVGAAKVEAKALQEVEAIDDAQGGDNGAGVLENADPGVGEGVQPVAAADGFEDPAPNNEREMPIPPVRSRLKELQNMQTRKRTQTRAYPLSIQSNFPLKSNTQYLPDLRNCLKRLATTLRKSTRPTY